MRLYHKDVRFYVARFLGNDPAVDDVAQEVFVQVYRSLDSFAGRSSLKSWILGIARNRVGTWFRQQSRQIQFQSVDIDSDMVQYRWLEWQNAEEQGHGESLSRQESLLHDVQLLRGCMDKLKPPHRALIQRFYFDGVTAEEMGREQGRNSGTVRMALLRIREALAKCMRKHAARLVSDE